MTLIQQNNQLLRISLYQQTKLLVTHFNLLFLYLNMFFSFDVQES